MKNSKLKQLCGTLIFTSMILLSTATTSFAGHKNYFIKSTIDYSGFGIMTEVINDDASGKNVSSGGSESPYEEEKGGYTYASVRHFGNISKNIAYTNQGAGYLTVNFLDDRSDGTARIKQYEGLQGVANEGLVFSFPGLKDGMNGGYNATSNDYTQATKVSETLTTGLNQALFFIRNNCMDNIVSNHSLHLALAKLSYTSELNRVGSYTILIGSRDSATSFTLSKVNENSKQVQENLIPVSGLSYNDYVKITVASGDNKGNYSYFPYKMAKGYYPNQALYEHVNSVYRENVKGNENEYLSWGQLILQAMLNFDTQGTAEQDFASDAQTIIGQGLGTDLSRTISSVRNSLGLASMSELVLNMGARPANYHLGVMTTNMHNISLTIYTLNLVISLLFVGFMIVKMIHQKMIATTNIIAKTSLMEGIKDIIFVAVMLGFFAPLFEILLELNYLIVRTFSYSSDYMSAFSMMGSKALAMESMAGFILSTMFLSIDMYINFVYVVRELVVAFLFAIAPLMIVSYLWSPTQKNMVFSYFRELIGNIFMQSFHAITMTFFAGYNTTNMTSLQALASAYCFIPITQLFRQLIIGNSGGFSEKIGGKLAGQVATTSMGMRKAGMTYKQSKEMLETQQKANMTQSAWSAGGQITASAIGATVGTLVAPGIGTVVGASIAGGLASAGGDFIGNASAQKEIGKTQLEHSKEQTGMGLAELGVGMGISSFDSAGDGMVRSGLSTIQEGAKTRGQADARYNPNSPFGLGDASIYAGLAGGVDAFGNSASRSISQGAKLYEKNNPIVPTYGEKTAVDSLPGLNGAIRAEHVHDIRNYNHSKGEFEMITNITQKDLNKPQFADLGNIYDSYRSRNANDRAMEDWKRISNETGIKEIARGLGDRLEFLMDAKRSGFLGEIGSETNISGIEEKKFYIDREQSRKKIN